MHLCLTFHFSREALMEIVDENSCKNITSCFIKETETTNPLYCCLLKTITIHMSNQNQTVNKSIQLWMSLYKMIYNEVWFFGCRCHKWALWKRRTDRWWAVFFYDPAWKKNHDLYWLFSWLGDNCLQNSVRHFNNHKIFLI